jgi:hypothetical protein
MPVIHGLHSLIDLLILQLSDAAMVEDPGLAVTLPLLTTGRPYVIVEQ